MYEIKLAALMFIRCILIFSKVHVATNVDAANPLDDILLKIGDTPVFMQLKHFKDKKLHSAHLTRPKSEFNLIQCYRAYCSIKKTWKENEDLQAFFPFEDAVFVLYTNAKYNHKISVNLDNQWQSVLNTGGTYFSFSKETHPIIYEMFENLPIIQNMLNADSGDMSNINALDGAQVLNSMCMTERKYLSKIINELDSMGELKNYKEFLSRVWLFTDQAGEQHLDRFIESDLGNLLGASDCHLTDCYLKFFKKIQEWWRCSKGNVITENSEFWKQIIDDCICRQIDFRVRELESTLKFSDIVLQSFRDNVFADDTSTLKIVSGSPAILTALKVHLCMAKENHLLIDESMFCKHQHEILVLWRRWCNVLLVIDSHADENWEMDKLLEILMANPRKMLVLVGCESQEKIHYLKGRKKTFHVVIDQFNVMQLNYKSYAHMQGLSVNLQGHNVAIREVMHCKYISGEILLELLSNKNQILGSLLNEVISYFIPRLLKRMDVVDGKIFLKDSKDYFIIGSTKELRSLIPEDKRICVYKQNNVNDVCQFLQVDEQFTDSDFEELCTIHKSINFHWFSVEENSKVVWKKSKENIAFIAKYLQDVTLYDSIYNIKDRMVIIVAEPGMGKTVLLSNIALHLKSLYPSMWIINILLNNHTDYLSQMDSTAVGLLEISAGIENPFEREVFYNCLHYTKNIIVLLDGFDEISPGNSDKVLKFVKVLLSDTKLKQIWISSRPTMKYVLQDAFSSLAFELVPFSREEQKLFLEKYWNVCDAENFVRKVLDLIAADMNDQLGKFTSIPLQLQLMGEVFREDMKHYRDTGIIKLPNTLDLLQLYSMFVDTKWEIYLRDKTKAVMSNEAQKKVYSKLRAMFIDQHEACALFTLLTEEEFSLLPEADGMKTKISNFIEELKVGEERTGIIIDYVNGQIVFIHRSFQEYFAALWLAKKFRTLSEILEDKIVNKEFKNVMIFFDRILARDSRLHIAVMNFDLKVVESLLKEDPSLICVTDKGGRTALHAAVLTCSSKLHEDNAQELCNKILSLILNAGPELNKHDEVLSWRPLRYADALKAWKLVGILLQEGANSEDLISANNIVSCADEEDKYYMEEFQTHSLTVALTIAMREGFTELLQFFISKGINIEKKYVCIDIYLYNYNLEMKVTLLQASSFWGHIDIVNLLLNKGAVVDACAHFKITALMCAAMGGHFEIMKSLLHHGANHNAQSTLLPSYYSKPPPWGMACNISNNIFNMIESKEYEKGCTVLHLAAIFCQMKAVEVVLQHKANVDLVDELGYTALHAAAEVGCLEIAELLIKSGASVNETNRWKQTPLHISVMNLHPEMAEYLINQGAEIDRTDIDGYTYLDLAVRVDIMGCEIKNFPSVFHSIPMDVTVRQVDLEAAKRLMKHGASLIQSKVRGLTPLHIAVINGNNVPLQWLIQQGAIVDCEDVNGNTALHLAARSTREMLAAAKYLIEKGAVVNKRNKCGKSPLHYAIEAKNLDLVAVLVEYSALINTQDNEGITPLHIAAVKGSLESVEFLIRKGASINEASFDGQIPLHFSVSAEQVTVTEYLIKKGACINRGDAYNKTSLHLASKLGLFDMVQLLLKHGAAVNSVTVCGETPLHYAAKAGHQHISEKLLRAGSCINKSSKHGFTALHLAVKHLEEMKYLQQQGADINQRDINGCTVLHLAALNGTLDVVQWLVEQGLSLNQKSNDGRVPMHFALEGQSYEVIDWILKHGVDRKLLQNCVNQLLQYAAFVDKPELIRNMVFWGGDIKKKLFKGCTVLHIAARMGRLKVVETLINLGANKNQRSDDGRTTLHFAAQEGRLNVVQWLVQHGCSPMVRSNNGTMPLHLAAKGKHLDVVQWLYMQGASLHEITNDGRTVMHFAAQGGEEELISWLKLRGVNIHEKSNDGRSIIHFLASSNDLTSIQWLVNAKGINIYEKTRDGATLIHFAFQKEILDLFSFNFLRNEGFSLFDECNDGRTAVHFAAIGKFTNVWFLETMEIDSIDWEKPCADGRTPVHFAAQGGALQSLQMLKSKGCNLFCRANDGRTAVHFAALGGNQHVMQWLIQEGCNLYEKTDDNRSVLHFAAEGGHLEMLKWLTKQNVNIHLKSKEGISVLHAAAKGGCVHALKWLVKHGFNLNEKSCDNRTVLHFAAEGGGLRAMQWLVKQGIDVHQRTSDSNTPLDCAMELGNVRVSDWLLEFFLYK